MTAPPGQWGVPPTPPPAEPRSRKKAALYAFFLGALGVHNFYLGQRKRGIGHIVLLGLAVLGFVAVGFYTLFIVFWYSDLYLGHTMDDTAQALSVVLMVLPFALIAINVIWAIVEGIVILAGPLEP
ncbi:MAG: TM2 domain-containing protein [Propionicimonas sp.]